MNATRHGRERRLSDIVIDPVLYPVTDELTGLERLVPEAPSAMERYAVFWSQRPALLPIRARAGAHAGELKRFIGLARESIGDIEANIDSCNALSILLNAANMAMLLVAPRNAEDVWARGAFARTLRRQAQRLKDDRLRNQVERVLANENTGLDKPANGDELGPFIALAAAGFVAGPPAHAATEGEPAVFALEQAPSLDLWFDQGIDVVDLLAGVRELFAMVQNWNGTADECQLAADAAAGARLLAFARLCRIGIWPARDRDEVAYKTAARRLLSTRTSEPDAMRALAEICFDLGEILAEQSERFKTISPA
ncbi:MAG: hypothetical protein EOP23_21670 [Hyphomicrobiales bacterium]|nr:MAG: hypothetical protein EOP23_21670 [Hyphomicrobiales bacterium]